MLTIIIECKSHIYSLCFIIGNKNVRQSHLMETKPVFHLDDDVIDDEEIDEDRQRGTSPYGSLKDLYLSREFSKYKKPLPSIQG